MMASLNLGMGWSRKAPMVLQTEAAECGLACLAMVAQYHNRRTDLQQLRRSYGMSLKGATLRDVIHVADQIGFASRPLRLELEELGQLRTPCILHWDLNHFVVLAAVERTRALIHDPAQGARWISFETLSRHFSGVALELTPTSGFEQAAPAPRVKASQLLGHIIGLKQALTKLFGLALAIEVFAMISPLFLGLVVDQALVSSDRDLLLTLALGFTVLLILRTAINTARGWMLMGLGASLKVQARANLFSHLIHLPTSYFEARYLGDVMSRFGSQDTILKAITQELVEVVLDGLLAILTFAFMLYFAPDLALLVLVGALLYALLRWATYTPLRVASNEAIVWGARRDSHFLESMRAIRTVKLFNGQEQRRLHWLNLLVETVNRQLTADKLSLLFRTVNSLLFGLLTILLVWLGANRVLDGQFSVGLLIAFLAYKDQFLGRISELINKTVDLTMLRLHAERLADIALTEPERRDVPTPLGETDRRPLAIELRGVSYRYSEQEPWVLQDINLKIAAGESVAICGPSGGGKSTLLKLLCGLLEPSRGEILVNGETLKRTGLERHRARIGVVMQDDQLFAGSIADNISFFNDQPNRELIEACAKLAAVHADIEALPMAYGSLIGDMGTVLSGGQKQRVLLARALYARPGLLLLDEATSHLDVEREQAVNAGLSRLSMTRIVIAHRPETIRAAGRVIAITKGKVNSGASPSSIVHQLSRLQARIAETAG